MIASSWRVIRRWNPTSRYVNGLFVFVIRSNSWISSPKDSRPRIIQKQRIKWSWKNSPLKKPYQLSRISKPPTVLRYRFVAQIFHFTRLPRTFATHNRFRKQQETRPSLHTEPKTRKFATICIFIVKTPEYFDKKLSKSSIFLAVFILILKACCITFLIPSSKLILRLLAIFDSSKQLYSQA